MFEADLNGDGLIGFNLSTIETNGDYSLATASGLYHIVDQSSGSIVTSFGNSNGNGGWSITQVEECKSGGFEIFWTHQDGRFIAHEIDQSGSKQSTNRRKLAEHEIVFEADLDGDGLIGFNLSTIENNGDYNLAKAAGLYHIVDQSSGSIVTSFGNSNGSGGWSITQVEESENGGFELFLAHQDGRTTAHEIDNSGNKQSTIRRKLAEHEIVFEADLNGDGLTTIENTGEIKLLQSLTQYYFLDGDDQLIGLTDLNGAAVGPNTFLPWKAVNATAGDSGGFELSWQDSSPASIASVAWKVSGAGQYQEHIEPA